VTVTLAYITFISLARVGKQLIDAIFSEAVRAAVTKWRSHLTIKQVIDHLQHPVALGQLLLPAIEQELRARNCSRKDVKNLAWANPCLHLQTAFDPGALPDTPTDFRPVPDAEGVLLAKVTAIACLATIDSDSVSYGSENHGDLFVNLVVIPPGKGAFSDKSTGKMSGHTDAVSFPIRGHRDPLNDRIAPSPDFVCLSSLRNPNEVPTTVMPLDQLMTHLSEAHIQELQKPQYILGSQLTFRDGMEGILGEELMVDDAQLLYEMQGKWWIRFSHRTTQIADTRQISAQEAMDALKEACAHCVVPLALAPGDIALVNNRIALHGRTEVGQESGGQTRWLLRTYGLDTSDIDPGQRHGDSPFMLFP
jgi:hypothetical protein